MLSNGFDTPLDLTLNGSRLWLRLELAVQLLAVTALLLPSALPWLIRGVLLMSVLFASGLTVWRYRRERAQPVKWRWLSGSCWMQYQSHNTIVWNLERGALVTSWFVLFRIRNATAMRTMILFRDQCSVTEFRRLRVRLRYYSEDEASPAATS